jgi:hypothetical protein
MKTVMFKKRTTVKICTQYAYLVFYMFEWMTEYFIEFVAIYSLGYQGGFSVLWNPAYKYYSHNTSFIHGFVNMFIIYISYY